MTVEDMIALDLGYAPPFAPVWDPILVAARQAAAAVRRAGDGRRDDTPFIRAVNQAPGPGAGPQTGIQAWDSYSYGQGQSNSG